MAVLLPPAHQHRQAATGAVPSAISVPVEVLALPEVFSIVEKANLPALSVCLQFPDLFDEVAILQRLAYKNRNQHRASKHYQAVCQVLKVLQRFEQLQLPALLRCLHSAAARTALPEALATTAGSSKRARRQQQQQPKQPAAARGQRQTVRLPSLQAGCFVLRRLLSGAQLLLDLHPALLAAGQHLSGQLSRGYFMPFCLVAAAAVARIRVLATTALLELLQGYNSTVQLLPLLPAAPATAGDSSSKRSSSEVTLSGVTSDGLPQMLQLSWTGPVPSLRSLCFEQQGPQSLQGLAAELQHTYGISGPSSAAGQAVAGGIPGSMQQPRPAQPADGGPTAAAGDVGVAISREAFMQQLQQQQQTQPRQQRQQHSRAPVPAISFYEDKQPAGGAGGADARQAAAAAVPQVPLYTTVPGLGFSLGQQRNAGPSVSQLLGGRGAAHASGGQAAAAGLAAGAGQAMAAATVAAGVQAMDMDVDLDSMPAREDQEEFMALYGQQLTTTPPPQHQQQQQPGVPNQQQQQQQTQPAAPVLGSAGQRVGVVAQQRRGLQASAALLAMQGAASSDDEDEGTVGARGAVPAAAVVAAAGMQAGQQMQEQRQAAASTMQPALAIPVASAAAAGTSAAAAAAGLTPTEGLVQAEAAASGIGSRAGTTGPGLPLLEARRGKQRKKGKLQDKPGGDKDAAAGGARPKDSILDMLLQGL